jgi:hypothetical protein
MSIISVKKNSILCKGHVPWNKGIKYIEYFGKNYVDPREGRPLSDIHRKHLSESLKGRVSPKGMLGKKHTEEWKIAARLRNARENHPEWGKNIKISKNKLDRIRFRDNYQKLVFKRDNYTCQMCGAKNGCGKTVSLQVDHIQSWKDYVELRFNINNCRTLCMDCHYFITWGKIKPKNIKTWGHNMKYKTIWA